MRVKERDKGEGREYSTSKMVATARAASVQSQDPGASSGSPMWYKHLSHLSVFPHMD